MAVQKLTAVVGTAVTTVLVVGAVTIEATTALLGGEIGPGILGVFAGVAAGLVAAGAVRWRWPTLGVRTRSVLLGYATFGTAILFLSGLSYVNAPGVDRYLGLSGSVAVAALLAVVAGLGSWQRSEPAVADAD